MKLYYPIIFVFLLLINLAEGQNKTEKNPEKSRWENRGESQRTILKSVNHMS
mgnify:CR=1 FL=1